ncbi:MAG: hypothetical protein ACOZAL_01810 [Patescibacteria group bacterium]
MKKFIIIGVVLMVAVAAVLVLQRSTKESEEYTLPEIVYCGHKKEISPDKLSQISYVEESMCSLFRGEAFASVEDAKAKYGVKVDLAQKTTSLKTLAITHHSAYPGDKVRAGDKEIKILSVNASSAQFEVDNVSKTIAVNQTDNFDNLEIKVKFACGITYRTDFNVTEYACCPLEEEGGISKWFIKIAKAEDEEEIDEDESDFIRKIREETEEDLKMSGRSGYRGVILPKNVARDYPSTDFVMLPFLAVPNELCCGCKQEYKNLSWWGGYLSGQVLSELSKTITELNEQKSEFEEDPYTLVERDEKAMRFALGEINLIKQNEEYFDPDTRIPKGEWINPDYVIEGGMEFRCCENSKLVQVTFIARFINAKTEKEFEKVSYAPAQCFDLVQEPGKLKAAVEDFAEEVSSATKNRFVKKK